MPRDTGSGTRWPAAADVEAALAAVPGVVAASVATDEEGRPVVLRVALDRDADEVDVAAATHRLLRMQFGVGLDPAHIEVVEQSVPEGTVPVPRLHVVDEHSRHLLELGPELAPMLARLDRFDDGGPRFPADVMDSASRHPAGADHLAATMVTSAPPAVATLAGRLAFARLDLVADGLGVVATVVLGRGDVAHVGAAEGSSTSSAVHRIVAAATAAAVGSALGPDHRLDVDAVAIAPVGSGEVAVVQVDWVTADTTERLTGASEVRDDVRQAVIRATLDAVNRRLAPALEDR